MILYRTSDLISVKIDDITVKVRPLSHQQKTELQSHMMKAVNGDMNEAMIGVKKALSFALKDIKGVYYYEDADKREYTLEFNDNKELADSCIDDILNLPISNKLNAVCAALLQGVPEAVLDKDGKPVKGIKILSKEDKKGKK